MKKLKENQLGPWCSFCLPEKTRATHVQTGWYGKFCCAAHQKDILDYENKQFKADQKMTDADYQTWDRL